MFLMAEQLAVRQAANEMAFHDKNLATADAMRVGRLHTFSPGATLKLPRVQLSRASSENPWTLLGSAGWLEANVAFMRSGGYSLSKRISELEPNVLVLWGRHDKILSPSYAQRFAEVLPDSKLQYLERSGHSPHLEEPAAVADIILDWLAAGLR
jgi:pimeloyl-ACP methyl ester carboxylesterase